MKDSRASLNSPQRQKNVAPIILLALVIVLGYSMTILFLHLDEMRAVLR